MRRLYSFGPLVTSSVVSYQVPVLALAHDRVIIGLHLWPHSRDWFFLKPGEIAIAQCPNVTSSQAAKAKLLHFDDLSATALRCFWSLTVLTRSNEQGQRGWVEFSKATILTVT
jgi:hypothetical protein